MGGKCCEVRIMYTSAYSRLWSNKVGCGGCSSRLLITYSSPSLSFTPLASLNFLLDFTDPCLMWHFGALWGFGWEPSDRGQWKVDWSLPSSRKCLAASAHLWITAAWGRFVTDPEVDGIASSPGTQANCCEEQDHQDEWEGFLWNGPRYGVPKQRHYTIAF